MITVSTATTMNNSQAMAEAVVLHDLEKDYEHTIVDIRNGHITNRKVGGLRQ